MVKINKELIEELELAELTLDRHLTNKEHIIKNKELIEELELAELTLDRHLTNKEHIIKVFGEDEFNRRLYFNRGKVEILKDKFAIVNKKIGGELIDEELENKLNELFPKERTSDDNLRAEVCHICFDVPNDEKNPKILRLIKKIQKESGRDRALVLFALAQNKINVLEEEIKELWNRLKPQVEEENMPDK